ncbi:MAG TPA: DUF748 domain-containing protein, partial [Ohtaekwangia sp.]|nr:DUF748 domain-containing protein [Ohtaekwangia sp.]
MKTRRRKITILISVVALVILLAGVRMWLPHFLLNKVNNALTRLDGYNGVARSVEVSLLRGAYTIHDITLHKKGGHITEPFFKATSIRIGIDWKSLLKGKLASELSASAPALHYVNGRDEASTQIRISNQWPMVLSSLLPLPLNRFTVVNGKVQFQDEQSTPAVALFMDSIALRGVNLLNIDQKQNSLPATVMGTGLHPTGTVALSLRLAPSPALPAFEMHAEINTLELPAMQNFINAYSHCDVRKGTLSLFVEAASKGSSITGSVRPVLTDLDADELKGTRDAAIRE